MFLKAIQEHERTLLRNEPFVGGSLLLRTRNLLIRDYGGLSKVTTMGL